MHAMPIVNKQNVTRGKKNYTSDTPLEVRQARDTTEFGMKVSILIAGRDPLTM